MITSLDHSNHCQAEARHRRRTTGGICHGPTSLRWDRNLNGHVAPVPDGHAAWGETKAKGVITCFDTIIRHLQAEQQSMKKNMQVLLQAYLK